MDTTWELYDMFQAFLQAPAYHLALEAFLLMWVMWLIFHKSYKPELTELTEQEKEELITEWTPEPLVPDTPEDHYALNTRTVSGKMGKIICVDGKKCLNMASHNYLGLMEDPKLEEAAVKSLRKYGVGSCGPRGFFGTVDVHLDLETKLSEFIGVEEAVLYSYGFATISSAIPAYSKHGDVIFCDEGANFAIQKGLAASRSSVKFFRHNDVNHLAHLLNEQEEIDKKNPKKARVTRRFLIVEGLYCNYGDICPLKELIELKKKHKVRLFVDESASFGVLGETGRGATEYFNIPVQDVDLISSTLENAIPAYGGFACGSFYVVDHQRLSGLGYCFSASLPPLQAAVAIAALQILESDPGIVSKLRRNSVAMHGHLQRIPSLQVNGDVISPIKHLYLSYETTRDDSIKNLEKIVDYAMNKGVALTVARYLEEEHKLPPPSIRLIVTAALETEDITRVVQILKDACDAVL